MTQDKTILVSDPWLRLEKVVGFHLENTALNVARTAFFHNRTCQCDYILHVLHDGSEGRMPVMTETSRKVIHVRRLTRLEWTKLDHPGPLHNQR
jgi:hypothetical protein